MSLKESTEVMYSRAFEDIVYIENGETIPVNYLSAGYQSLLWMVMDMAFRMANLNPEKLSLNQCEGIVLIDEIDMHLHPKWQWKIVESLQECFPKIHLYLPHIRLSLFLPVKMLLYWKLTVTRQFQNYRMLMHILWQMCLHIAREVLESRTS